jgi:RNA-binding protein
LVQIGTKGIGESVIEQIDAQLLAHELVKVRFNTESTVEPAEAVDEVVARTRSELVQKMGRILILYRRHDEKPKIALPSARAPRVASGR